LQIFAVIIVPNRELAVQVYNVIHPLATAIGVICAKFVGGPTIKLEIDATNFEKDGYV
jgi:superfamily II DNA/RNA helicase